jgi:coiled-coil domain-containing protein 40
VEEFNDQMKSEIAVTRRQTYRAEENVTTIEKEKAKQDSLIDQMNEEIKRLNEQLTLYHAQLMSQREETQAAREV